MFRKTLQRRLAAVHIASSAVGGMISFKKLTNAHTWHLGGTPRRDGSVLRKYTILSPSSFGAGDE